jgi:serine/threonine-protein kinase
MAIQPGPKLLHYELAEQIGEGGMGVVWRGRDTKLDRDVAIKILPDDFARDPDRLARFEREAKLLASLNHTNIATIHGLERDAGLHFIAMELVEGEDLAARIGRGAIPVEEALPLALQIASALEAAHERGVIHRDLKPPNIKVTPEGTVKVLDFGLAKTFGPAAQDPTASPTMSPTVTSAGNTAVGVILGTAAYMSPEQAKGKPVDRRADIWSFGVVLLEMLTGRLQFRGESVSETIAAVLTAEPDLSGLPANTPPKMRRLIERCLRKDPQSRLRDIGDARVVVEEAIAGREWENVPSVQGTSGRRLPIAVAGVVVGALLASIAAFFMRTEAPPRVDVTRFAVDVATGQLGRPFPRRPINRAFALSPDGRQLAYVATDREGSRLYLRPLDQLHSVEIAGTDGADAPFFSPDGESIGFFKGDELMRVRSDGTELRGIHTTGGGSHGRGASWTAQGTILLSGDEGVLQVSAEGGGLTRLTTHELGPGYSHSFPQLLPGGGALLYNEGTTRDTPPSQWDIVAESLETGRRVVVVEGGSDPHYVSTGHIVFARDGALMAVAFDVSQLETMGEPVVVIEGVMHSEGGSSKWTNVGAAHFAVSASGTLAYVGGGIYPSLQRQLLWVDRKGNAEPVPVPSAEYRQPRFSPDGMRLAYSEGAYGKPATLWIYDVELRTPLPLQTQRSSKSVVWSPDGAQIVYNSLEGSDRVNLYIRAADGRGQPQRLTDTPLPQSPSSWSRNGVLAFVQGNYPEGTIMTMSMDGDRTPDPFLQTGEQLGFPAFSPDGNWLAYTSDKTGRSEVYVARSIHKLGRP